MQCKIVVKRILKDFDLASFDLKARGLPLLDKVLKEQLLRLTELLHFAALVNFIIESF